MNLIIDIGNTAAKLAVFQKGEVVELYRDSNVSLDSLTAICEKYPIERAIYSTVTHLSERIQEQLRALPFPLINVSECKRLPIHVLYKSPQTLGSDRIAAVVGAQGIKPNRDLLVIDAGTCITYELLDAAGNYLGGNISAGKAMRFKALQAFTSKLPLVADEGDIPEIGYNTETAIRAGIVRGIEYEIMGYIRHLQEKYPSLLVFLTGGDSFSFDTNLKNIIFADSFLVLKGLNRILEYNDTI